VSNPLFPDSGDDFEKLLSIMEAILGPERWKRVSEELLADYRAFIDTPLTWRAKFDSIMQEALSEPDSEEFLLRILPHLAAYLEYEKHNAAIRYEHAVDTFASQPSALALREHLIAVAPSAPREALVLAFPSWDGFDRLRRIFGGTPGLGRMIEAGNADPVSVSFEEHARTIASVVAGMAEQYYKPLLGCALAVCRLASSDLRPVPQTVGAIMSECQQLWEVAHPELLPLVRSDLRIIRNSEFHKHTVIDASAETILFVNVKPNGDRESIGPLDRAGLAEVVGPIIVLCRALDVAIESAARRLGIATR
jgi:hypothetical protein